MQLARVLDQDQALVTRRELGEERVGERGLARAGVVLEQHVAVGEQRDEQPFDQRRLADDLGGKRIPQLVERFVQRAGLDLVAVHRGAVTPPGGTDSDPDGDWMVPSPERPFMQRKRGPFGPRSAVMA